MNAVRYVPRRRAVGGRSNTPAPLAVALLIAVGASACARDTGLPDPGSPDYAQAVRAFYTGVAAAQVGETGVAEAALRRVTELAAEEPAGWANLGVVALHRRELAEAAARLERARTLAPDDAAIAFVSAIVARERGDAEAASEHLRRAVALDPRHLKALYLLARTVEEEDRPESVAEAQQLVERILDVQPDNLVALLEAARLAAKRGAGDTLEQLLGRFPTPGERAAVLGQLRTVRSAARAGDFRRAATEIAFLQTELQPLSAYRDDEDALVTSPGRAELVFTRFLRLPTSVAAPAPPDTTLAFVPESLWVGGAPVSWVRALWLGDALPLALVSAGREVVWISTDPGHADTVAFPGGASGMALLDYDYDFLVDLALVGTRGLRLFRQTGIGAFTDVTAEAVPAGVARGAYVGAWAADLDMEGDLDLVLARADGPPVVLLNRGDGTFERGSGFERVSRVRQFLWADMDADGDPDAALLDAAGRLHLFANRRHLVPQFAPFPLPDTLGRVHAIAVADLDADAVLDLLLLGADGTLSRLWLSDRGWRTQVLARWHDYPAVGAAETRLFVADLDNNGALDVVASTPRGSQVWLSTAQGFAPHHAAAVRVSDVADIGGAGRLDLIGVSPDGASWRLASRGDRDYYAASIRPQAAGATGDRRVNPFGLGGEIEIRAGLLYQKQVIQRPTVHFGLGAHERVDVARIIWPNGTVQAEFSLAGTNETVVTRQRLKGSCPWVFAFDGQAMRFVTDFLWRTALGLRINAQGDAAVIHAEDWIRIPGDRLAPRDGFYDIRITGELWETHFFDHIALLVVDHPAGTEVFVDERFTLPAPVPAVHTMGPLQPIARAWDHHGRDVTERVRALDEQYLDTFELGPYQGVVDEHYVEVELGDDVPTAGPLWLVASGWVYPTDASINVAISQGGHGRPAGLTLDVPDGRGGWVTVEANLGFPAGKSKTILIDLTGAFRPGAPRRVRLRTTLEVYWERLAWAAGAPDTPLVTRRLLPATAELRYRGFSEVRQDGRRAPELPVYDRVVTTTAQWRDLVGYYTRFGDVRALNAAVDDRYIIMNAGDELVLRFPAEPPPRAGWVRDFVLIGDGWVKDGDYNTGFSTTVLPLPYHGMTDYARPPGRLQDDPAYRRHPDDWRIFHTRYVTPRHFHRALVTERHD